MNRNFTILALIPVLLVSCFATPLLGQTSDPDDTSRIILPRTKISGMVLSHLDVKEKRYLAFPVLTRLNKDELLITFKRGTAHGNDNQADCDLLRYHTGKNEVMEHRTIGSIPGRKFQLTVPVRMGDGSLRFYTDFQHTGQDGRHYRNGMRFTQSDDGAKTVGPWKKLDLVEGVEYAYPFDFIVEGKVVYMLAMSFGYRPGERWSVAALRSEDGGNTWKLAGNITEALGGIAINESSFARTEEGFLVVVRGYRDQASRIARFDHEFNLLDARDLTGTGLLKGLIGWPRIFMKDGKAYVLGRMWTRQAAGFAEYMQLGLLRINPGTLDMEKIILLDNETGQLPVTDGYYAGHYWTESNGEPWFNLITYKAVGEGTYPDLVRMAYRWNEIR